MRFLGKIISFLLLIIFLITLPLSLWLYNAQQSLFDPTTYQRIVENQRLYTDFLPTFLPSLLESLEGTTANPIAVGRTQEFFDNMADDDWGDIAILIAPPDWLQSQVQFNIDALFAWIDGPDVTPVFEFDLVVLKDRLRGPEGVDTVTLVVASWPLCSADEEALVSQILADTASESALPACQPQDNGLYSDLIGDLSENLSATGDELPTSIQAGDASGETLSPASQRQWLNLKLLLRVVRRLDYLIFLIPLVVLILIEIVTIRSFRELFRWNGWALLIGGLLSLLLLIPVTAFPLLAWQTLTGSSVIAPSNVPVIIGVTNLFNQIATPILVQGGIVTVVGIVFLGLGSMLARQRESESAA